MTRVKKGLTKNRRHKKILAATKGFRGAKSKLVKVAKEALMHAGSYAFAGRKLRKRDKRRLWISQINSALGEDNSSYSQFINNLKKARIEIDRKILADLAATDKNTFDQIVKKIQTP